MSKKHFLPFQINTTIFIFVNFFYKMAASGHFGWPKLTLDGISGYFRSIQNSFFWNFYKMAAGAHFGCPKFTFDHISGHFRSIRKFIFLEIFDKMAAVGHFGCPKFTFDHTSGHFWSMRNLFFLEIHFRSHFWPLQINTDFIFFIFYKMATLPICMLE